MPASDIQLEGQQGLRILRLQSDDGTNRLTRQFVLSLTDAVHSLVREDQLLVIAGNHRFFSAGTDLREIAALYPAAQSSL